MKKRINGTGSVWKRGKVFVWQYRDVNNKMRAITVRDEKGIPAKTKTEAEKIVAGLQAEKTKLQSIESKIEYLAKVAESKKLIDTQGKIKISEIWGCYLASTTRPDSGGKTLQGYKEGVDTFEDWLSKEFPSISTINEITEDISCRFASYYWDTGVSETTYNARISALKLVFKVLLRNENNPFLPIRKKIEQQQSRNAFTIEQLKAISETIDNPSYHMLYKKEMRIMMLIMLYTGCRGEDACLMSWDSVDLNTKIINYIPMKTARKRPVPVIIPIATPLYAELKQITICEAENYVLPNVAKRYQHNPCGISTDISKLLEKAGIKTHDKNCSARRKRAVVKYSMHSFRHTFCTLAVNRGMPITAIQSIVGHSTSAMTQHYSHISLETKANVVKCLPCFSVQQMTTEEVEFTAQVEKIISLQQEKVIAWLDKKLTNKQKTEFLAI